MGGVLSRVPVLRKHSPACPTPDTPPTNNALAYSVDQNMVWVLFPGVFILIIQSEGFWKDTRVVRSLLSDSMSLCLKVLLYILSISWGKSSVEEQVESTSVPDSAGDTWATVWCPQLCSMK